ncbi:MAG: PEGA domain-containing protein [Fibrobacter sp.]|nr:PEGA domain-containing protein [Fibrobacter sp.]
MRLINFTVFLYFISLPVLGASTDSTVQKLSADTNKIVPEKASEINQKQLKTIKINSEPSGATVIVDDSTRGISPVILQLEPGNHQIVLRKKGFYLKRAEFVVDSLSPEELVLTLQQPGSLLIKSEPAGAEVLIDGQNQGVTPILQKQLKPGNYPIKIQLTDYEPIEKEIELKSGASDTLNFVLKHTASYIDSVTAVTSRKKQFEKRLHLGIVGGVFLIFGLVLLGMEIKG